MRYLKILLNHELANLQDHLKGLEDQDIAKDKAQIKAEIDKINGILTSFSDEM